MGEGDVFDYITASVHRDESGSDLNISERPERAGLEYEFGRYGPRLYELACGVDDNPVVRSSRLGPYPSRHISRGCAVTGN
jgi:hypothetical protein